MALGNCPDSKQAEGEVFLQSSERPGCVASALAEAKIEPFTSPEEISRGDTTGFTGGEERKLAPLTQLTQRGRFTAAD